MGSGTVQSETIGAPRDHEGYVLQVLVILTRTRVCEWEGGSSRSADRASTEYVCLSCLLSAERGNHFFVGVSRNRRRHRRRETRCRTARDWDSKYTPEQTNLVRLNWPHRELWKSSRFFGWTRLNRFRENVERRWVQTPLRHGSCYPVHETIKILEVIVHGPFEIF